MAYLGSTPTTSSQSLVKQDFSVSATQNYTLSHSVSSANDIALYINNCMYSLYSPPYIYIIYQSEGGTVSWMPWA